MQLLLYFFGVLLIGACGENGDRNSDQVSQSERASKRPDEPIAPSAEPQSDFEKMLKEAHSKRDLSVAEIEKYFVDSDNINKRDKGTGNTPLLAAAQYNQTALVKYLLNKGANPNEVNYHTALVLASIMHNNAEMVQALLDKGADPKLPKSYPVADWVLTNGNVEILEKFLKKYPSLANWKCDQDGTLLHHAVRMLKRPHEMVKLLLSYGADKTIKNSRGQTAWDFALPDVKSAVPELKP